LATSGSKGAHLRQKIARIPLDFRLEGSMYVGVMSEDPTMANDALKGALLALFPMITTRLKQAHDIAAAAGACAATGNNDGAFRILLDVEQHVYEATTLLNAACLIRREKEE
jgi:hypothetical protein